MRKIELDSRAYIASVNEMKFIALGSEKTQDPEFITEFIIPKIHKDTTRHNDDFWGTLGLSNDEKINWKGHLEISSRGNETQEGVVREEIEDIKLCFPELNLDGTSVMEHFVSFEHVDFDFPESFPLDRLPSVRLDLMIRQDHGAVVFYQSDRDSKDKETAIEYILPKATPGNNTNERDRLTYHFDLVPPNALEKLEGTPGFYHLSSTKNQAPFIVKIITFKRNWESADNQRFARESSRDIIERATRALADNDIRNTIAVDHELLVFKAEKNKFVKAKKGSVKAGLKTLCLIHGTFGSTESSFGKLYGSQGKWLKALLEQGTYSQIMAFDHPTVFFGAEENMALFLMELEKLVDDPFAYDMDFIGTSQGGLLVQYLANLRDKGILKVGRVALIASANGVQYFTVGKFVCKFLSAMRYILKMTGNQGASLAASLAQHSAGFLLNQPGFKIMTPGDEKLLQIINIPPVSSKTLYLPLVGDYDDEIIDNKDWKTLKKKLMKFGAGLVDGFAGSILGKENDWVVGTRYQYMVPAGYCAIPDYNPAKFRDDMIPAIHGSCIYDKKAQLKLENFFAGKAIERRTGRVDLFDAHCHLFGREIISPRVILLLLEELVQYGESKDRTENLIEIPRIPDNSLSGAKGNLGAVAWNIIRYFLMNKDSDHMLHDLEDEYYKLKSGVYKYIPLMFDLEMAFRNSYENQDDDQSLLDVEREFRERLREFRKDIKKLIRKYERNDEIIYYGSLADNEESVKMLKIIGECLKYLKPEDLNLVEDAKTGYRKQLEGLKGLKVRYGNNIYPFLAVDPRRDGMEKLILDNVGKNKTFRGIKLYPPNGYSPTDPHLFDDKMAFVDGMSLYSYCIRHNIPIMVHCSDGGFATFVRNLEVWGDICLYEGTEQKPVLKHYAKPGEIFFRSTFLSGGFAQSVRERAYTLNHPVLWEKVLGAYPDLKICFAHFGGESDDWRGRLANLMKYDHVYTDLSCTADRSLLEKIRNDYFNASPANPITGRIMYGSDYVLNMLSVKEFGDYYGNFTDPSLFTSQQLEDMALHVPMKFLF